MIIAKQVVINANTNGLTLSDTHFMGKSQGAVMISTVKSGYIADLEIEDCDYSGDPDQPLTGTLNWGERAYNQRGLTKRTNIRGRNIPKEHLFYWGTVDNAILENIEAVDIGSQLLQHAPREYESFAGAADNRKGVISIRNVKGERIGTSFGRRPSWNIALYDYQLQARDANGNPIFDAHGAAVRGPRVASKTDYELYGINLKGYGWEHVVSGNRQCNSTGAILVQEGDYFSLERSNFDYVRPDREVIQVFRRKNCVIKPIYLAKDNDIVLHDMDNCTVRISPGTGLGEIRRRALNSHVTTFLSTIKAGYSN
jgi:hypothetical protein